MNNPQSPAGAYGRRRCGDNYLLRNQAYHLSNLLNCFIFSASLLLLNPPKELVQDVPRTDAARQSTIVVDSVTHSLTSGAPSVIAHMALGAFRAFDLRLQLSFALAPLRDSLFMHTKDRCRA